MNVTSKKNNHIMEITKDTTIEDIVNHSPDAVKYLSQKGIKCIACGEPVWGTLADAAIEKGFSETEIDSFVSDLNSLK